MTKRQMAKIHELSETLSNQIAAGEVIERPASVVKELIENAIDAGSDRIRVDFIDAGLRQITVQDNGTGIEADQLDLAFTRHATSKISNERDLFKVATLGFRGEALASIAAVSHVEILTSTDDISGTRALFSAGGKKSQEEAAARKGTQITVSDLFFNTPARLKYLKSPRTEAMKIVDIVNRIALGHPDISFTLSNQSKILLKTAGNNNLKQTVASIYGRPIAEKMVEIQKSDSDFEVTGLVSKPELTRSNRNFISILLNGRYIKNFQLNTAIMDGYGNKLAAKHYPVAVIDIKVDPLLVDVNVHPTKQEVRLSKEKELGRLIVQAISEIMLEQNEEGSFDNLATNQKPSIVDQLQFNLNKNVVDTSRKAAPEVREIKPKLSVPLSYVDLSKPRQDKKYFITESWRGNVAKQVKLSPFPSQKVGNIVSSADEKLQRNLPDLNYLGQSQRYLLAEDKEDLYLIDQLMAQRQISYLKIYQQLQQKIVKQTLLTPVVLEFGKLDFLQLQSQSKRLAKLGISLEEFGQNSFIIHSYPTWIKGDVEQSLRKVFDQLLNSEKNSDQDIFKQLAINEAKMQVSGRKKLTELEAVDLINELSKQLDPYYDASGNKIIVKLSQSDLRKMFKRN